MWNTVWTSLHLIQRCVCSVADVLVTHGALWRPRSRSLSCLEVFVSTYSRGRASCSRSRKTSWESELPRVRRETSTFTWHDLCTYQSNQSVQSDKLHICDQCGEVIQAVTPLKSAVTQHNGLEAASDTRTEKVAPMSERLTSLSVWLSPKIEANCLRKQCILEGGVQQSGGAPTERRHVMPSSDVSMWGGSLSPSPVCTFDTASRELAW